SYLYLGGRAESWRYVRQPLVDQDRGRRRVVTITRQARWTRADGVLRADSEFRMGSNTKTMIATLVLQLVGRMPYCPATPGTRRPARRCQACLPVRGPLAGC